MTSELCKEQFLPVYVALKKKKCTSSYLINAFTLNVLSDILTCLFLNNV
jgi:hypothetical protein